MGNTININDGLKVYDIANQDGKVIGQFKINPTDGKIVERYETSLKKLNGLKQKYKNSDNDLKAFIELQKTVENEFVYIVGNDSVKVFFEVMGAFSLQDGQFYFEKVIEIIGGILNEEGEKHKKAMKKRIDKYAKRYQ